MDLNNENWRYIPGENGKYKVSDMGRVMNAYTGRILRGTIKDTGYIKVNLSGHKSRTVHRLVMIAFNPVEGYERLEVDHLDMDKTNNRLSNLEWVTKSDNQKRRFKVTGEGMPKGAEKERGKIKPISVYNQDTGSTAEFNSLHNFCKFMGYPHATVYKYMVSKKPYKGYLITRR